MNVIALTNFISTVYGDITKGQRIDNMPDGYAKQLRDAGMVANADTYQTKVIHSVPLVAGVTKPAPSSPADQASPKKMQKRPGKKRR